MTKADEVLAKLTKVFREAFDDETIVARPDMTASEVEQWDSLSHLDMLLLVEENFEIRFATHEIADLMKVDDLVRLVVAKTR